VETSSSFMYAEQGEAVEESVLQMALEALAL
jgi:hypothetical protein